MKMRVSVEMEVKVTPWFRVAHLEWWAETKIEAVRVWYASDGLRVFQSNEWKVKGRVGPVFPDGWVRAAHDLIPPRAVDPMPGDRMPPWRPAQFKNGVVM